MPAVAGATGNYAMPFKFATVWTDHNHAEITRFDSETAETHKLRAHAHPTGQHASAVRAEHEFMAQVCAAIEAVPQVLVTGSHTVLADFKHYVDKHRAQADKHIAGYEVVGSLTEGQRLAQARKYFADLERLAPRG